MSLDWLLGPQLEAFVAAGYEVVGASAPGAHVAAIEARGVRHVALRHATRSMAPHRDLRSSASCGRCSPPCARHRAHPQPEAGVVRAPGGPAGRGAGDREHGARALRPPGGSVAPAGGGLRARADGRRLLGRRAGAEPRGPGRAAPPAGPGGPAAPARQRRRPRPLRAARGRHRARGRRSGAPGGSAPTRWSWAPSVGWCARRGSPSCWRRPGSSADGAPRRGWSWWARTTRPRPTPSARRTGRRARRRGCVFAGRRDDMTDVYGAFDLYVLASHREGFPRSAMEAAAMGLPIVATDIRGCREVVDRGVTGLLVPVGDGSAIARAVERPGPGSGPPADHGWRRVAPGQAGVRPAAGDRPHARGLRRADRCGIGPATLHAARRAGGNLARRPDRGARA